MTGFAGVLTFRSPVTEYNSQSNHNLPWLRIKATYSFQKLVAGVRASYKRYERVVAVPVSVTLAVLESAIFTQKSSFVDFLSARAIVYSN